MMSLRLREACKTFSVGRRLTVRWRLATLRTCELWRWWARTLGRTRSGSFGIIASTRAGLNALRARRFAGEERTPTTCLNVFEKFQPRIPKEYEDTEFLFLANIQPTLQANVRRAMNGVRLTGCDTMNYWIQRTPTELAETLKLVDVLLINDTETKMLAHESNLPRAAQKVLAMGPQALVIKHGEYGATIFFREGAFGIGHHPFRAPSLPIEEVKDPTGAGDSFAGGFMGYLASQEDLTREVLKRALFYGGVMGSFAVERFGTERLQGLTRDEIDARFEVFRELTHLE